MATLGFLTLLDRTAPSLWDLTEMKKLELADGRTFDEMIGDIEDGLREVNAALLSGPHYPSLFSVQDDVEVEYPVGVSNGVEEATEFGVPSPKRGAVTGHSLPLKSYDRALGWTMMGLKKARSAKLDADVRSAVTDIKNAWQKHLLTRFFKMEGETVGSTSNASVPFADGGTTDATYVPPDSPDGESFASSHDHFLRVDTIANALPVAIETLQEHGHASPFEIIGARADAATWKAVTGWKAPEWPGIVYHASATERAAMSEVSDYFGYIETTYGIARVWLTPRVPTNIFGMFKDYGPGDMRAPLRVRIHPNVGFGWSIVPGNFVNAPQLLAVLYSEYGVGTGEDRTNGVATYINASGDYVTPTIS